MERTKMPSGRHLIQWKNRGGGTFSMSDNRQIKSGETFSADPRDVPPAFRSTIVPLEPLPALDMNDADIPAVPVEMSFFLQPRKTRGWFNVVDKEGNLINEQALRREEAEQLIRNKQDAKSNLL